MPGQNLCKGQSLLTSLSSSQQPCVNEWIYSPRAPETPKFTFLGPLGLLLGRNQEIDSLYVSKEGEGSGGSEVTVVPTVCSVCWCSVCVCLILLITSVSQHLCMILLAVLVPFCVRCPFPLINSLTFSYRFDGILCHIHVLQSVPICLFFVFSLL